MCVVVVVVLYVLWWWLWCVVVVVVVCVLVWLAAHQVWRNCSTRRRMLAADGEYVSLCLSFSLSLCLSMSLSLSLSPCLSVSVWRSGGRSPPQQQDKMTTEQVTVLAQSALLTAQSSFKNKTR